MIGVLKYPGGHGEADLIHVLQEALHTRVREVWYKETGYTDVELLFIGSGFPCVENGSLHDCFRNSPALQYLKDYSEGGQKIVGFGNGFRLLCEAGLLPGELKKNKQGRFIGKEVFLKPENNSTYITSGMDVETILRLPVATDYGCYSAEDDVLVTMRNNGQILYRYCDTDGRITESVNYTGSVDNIAAVCNERKNVFGMVPLPERAVEILGREADGKFILQSLLQQVLTD